MSRDKENQKKKKKFCDLFDEAKRSKYQTTNYAIEGLAKRNYYIYYALLCNIRVARGEPQHKSRELMVGPFPRTPRLEMLHAVFKLKAPKPFAARGTIIAFTFNLHHGFYFVFYVQRSGFYC